MHIPGIEYGIPAIVGIVAGLLLVGIHWFATHKSVNRVSSNTSDAAQVAAAERASERRVTPRRRNRPTSVFYSRNEEKEMAALAYVLDISMGGLALVVTETFSEGTRLFLLPQHAPVATPWVEVEVRSCRKTSAGWTIGCAFVKSPTYPVFLLFC